MAKASMKYMGEFVYAVTTAEGSFYLCLRPMNNEDKMIPSAAVTA